VNTMMENFLKEAQKQPYFSNGSGRPHEKNIERLLIKNGFVQTTIEDCGITKKDIKEIKNASLSKKIQPCMFVAQPCSSQSFPDFIVSDETGRVFYVECKSKKKTDTITWNSGKPKKGAIYIFSCGRNNAQTFVMGEIFWTDEEREIFNEIFREMKATQKKGAAKFKDIGSKLYPYCREMHQDSQKVYGHADRLKREQAVFDHVRS
jgi:hypothetical protein